MAKRKTTKVVRGVKVVTNPKFTRDEETELEPWLEQILQEKLRAFTDWHRSWARSVYITGIAIGRARATASGKKVGKR